MTNDCLRHLCVCSFIYRLYLKTTLYGWPIERLNHISLSWIELINIHDLDVNTQRHWSAVCSNVRCLASPHGELRQTAAKMTDSAVLIELNSIRTASSVRYRTLPVAVWTLQLKYMCSIRPVPDGNARWCASTHGDARCRPLPSAVWMALKR